MRITTGYSRIITVVCLSIVFVLGGVMSASNAEMAGVDVNKISDMSGFNPATYESPTGDDTIKIGYINSFSGPGAVNGRNYWIPNSFVVYDINKRGGIMVDGKRKMIEIIKGDNQGKAALTKKMSEKLCLQDKVDVLWGNSGSHLCLITQHVAKKYKTIYVNPLSQSEHLMNAENFNRYTFRPCLTTSQFAYATAYYYKSQKERKFYILNQDYSFGHETAEHFKEGLKKYVPDAVVVGEAYHPLFLKDFAPYITKISASGAEVIFTSDWDPDIANFIKTARQLGVNLPFANCFCVAASTFKSLGGPGGAGCVNIYDYTLSIDSPSNNTFVDIYHESWKKWTSPYNITMSMWPNNGIGLCINTLYWLYSVIERAGSTDPEKIIATWEGDEFKGITDGVMKMRADDHQVIHELYATVYAYPNRFLDDAAYCGPVTVIPAEFCEPPLDPKLKGRAKK